MNAVNEVSQSDQREQVERIVMCVGTWPEDNYADFIVFPVKQGESDKDAIARAQEAYGEDHEFYIK